MSIYLSSTGLAQTPLLTTKNDLLQEVINFDPTYTSLPLSLQENLASMGAVLIQQVENAIVFNLTAVSPAFQTNLYLLQQFGAFVGLTFKGAVSVQVLVILSGTAGSVLPAGTIFNTTAGDKPCTNANRVIIPATGQASVIVQATSPTVTHISPNTLIVLPANIVSYGFSCNNPSASISGYPAETETAYRYRVNAGMRGYNFGQIDTMIAKVLGVDGTIARLTTIAPNNTTGGYVAIVGGGDVNEVASTLAQSSPYIPWFVSTFTGNVPAPPAQVINTTVSYVGNTWDMTYVSPSQASLTLNIVWRATIATDTNAVSDIIRIAVLGYCNAIGVGQVLNILALQAIIIDSLGQYLLPAEISMLTITNTGGTLVGNLLSFNPWEYIDLLADDVTVTPFI